MTRKSSFRLSKRRVSLVKRQSEAGAKIRSKSPARKRSSFRIRKTLKKKPRRNPRLKRKARTSTRRPSIRSLLRELRDLIDPSSRDVKNPARARSFSDGVEGVTAVSTTHTPSASQRQSMLSVTSKWSECEFADGEMVFSMTELTTSSGNQRTKLRDRYLEITQFPSPDQPGKGKYFLKGMERSVFTFQGGETGCFDAKQRNGRPFYLAPIVEDDKPVGFVWTMPAEYPLFEARFGLSEAARKELAEVRVRARKTSAFGRKRKISTFGAWQNRFAKKRHNIKLNLHSKVDEAVLHVRRQSDGSFQVFPVVDQKK